MTIRREKGGEYSIQCDECPEALGGCASFEDARSTARDAGWSTFKGPDDEWANACPACVEKFAEGKRRTS